MSEVKEVTQARITFADITYTELLTIFPDDLSCERYLEEIKWKDGYTCKKCDNHKYGNGSKKFSRRCSTCRYDESVTAYTIFHSCKFPLVKAFYIITKVNKVGEDLNSYELSRELDLRKGTVWDFKKKVIESRQTGADASNNTLYTIILNYLGN